MIGYIDPSNCPSIQLHETFGFRQVGYLRVDRIELGDWNDLVIMQRSLGPVARSQPDMWL